MVRLHQVDVSVDAAALIPPSRLSGIRVHENGQHVLASFDDVGGVVNADGERGVSAIVVENLLAVQEDVRVSEDALEPEPDRGAGVVGRERELFSARAENRRKGRLGALRAHTKAPYKMDFRRKTLRNAKAA